MAMYETPHRKSRLDDQRDERVVSPAFVLAWCHSLLSVSVGRVLRGALHQISSVDNQSERTVEWLLLPGRSVALCFQRVSGSVLHGTLYRIPRLDDQRDEDLHPG